MKAAVCHEFGKPLVIEEIEISRPQNNEVKIRLASTAICHSDIHVIRGDMPVTLPMVPGHESAGYVEEVGTNVSATKVGDPVIVSSLANCGQCRYCLNGLPHLCQTFPMDIEGRLHDKQGRNVVQMSKVAGFAEYTLVHESQVVKIPADMPLDRAALLSCGVMTGFGAVVNRAQVKALESVMVLGAGGVGLNTIQGASFAGAYPIIAVDVLDNKLEAARIFGATHTINARSEQSLNIVQKITSGAGMDYVFVTGGGAAAVNQGYSMLARRGTLVLIALPEAKEAPVFPFLPDFIGGEKRIIGSFYGSCKLRIDIPHLVDLYQAGRLKLDELITKRYPLQQINEAISSVERGEALRNVIVFQESQVKA
jgi:S-(hydroxymethyl)glutathione dehydrogenase / alcohol dehydrogenase